MSVVMYVMSCEMSCYFEWFLSLYAIVILSFFFFSKQTTAYEMRIRDWSSDVCSSDLSRDPHRQRAVAAQEVGVEPVRRAGDLYVEVASEDLLPQDAQLHLGDAVADAAVDAGTERDVQARPGAVDDEAVGVLDRALVAVAGDVPHHDLVAGADGPAAEFGVGARGAAHVDQIGRAHV